MQEVIEELSQIRATLDRLEARLGRPATDPGRRNPVTSEGRSEAPAASDEERQSFRSVTVLYWDVGEKSGKRWARLTSTQHEKWPVFDEKLIDAMDPLFRGDQVKVFLGAFKQKDGTTAWKVTGCEIVARAEPKYRDHRDGIDATEIPF